LTAAGDRFAERTDLCHQYSLSPVENFIGGVVDTGEQFITGAVDTGEQFKFKQFKFIASFNDTGDNIFPRSEITKKPKIYRQCQRHRRKIVQRLESPASISLPTPKNEK
jgi:hypothetical protein